MSLGTWLPILFGLFATTYSHFWDYSKLGPEKWAAKYPDCGGQRQSPINLRKVEADLLDMPRLNMQGIYVDLSNYDRAASGTIVNNGHSVNLVLYYPSQDLKPRVTIEGPYYPGTYYCNKMHFHWPSEHRLEGRGFPLELHMVHNDPETGNNLVLGFLFETCADDGLNSAPSGLAKIADMASRRQREVDKKSLVTDFKPESIMSDLGYMSRGKVHGCGFYAYDGSLTTPPCTENVIWLVHKQPLCIFDWELDSFYNVHTANHTSMAGNTRPMQALNDRQILNFNC